eukprot:2679006-Pyramimonas_sp.AAC.1
MVQAIGHGYIILLSVSRAPTTYFGTAPVDAAPRPPPPSASLRIHILKQPCRSPSALRIPPAPASAASSPASAPFRH